MSPRLRRPLTDRCGQRQSIRLAYARHGIDEAVTCERIERFATTSFHVAEKTLASWQKNSPETRKVLLPLKFESSELQIAEHEQACGADRHITHEVNPGYKDRE
eukprot:TRINITY_DN75634_c0_g1_i1.p1 TRINITY_DN75634_c0_g1~~TRINITY_DN75634_c0_g1_i1.p1  ORF type:complete len:104 (-),score=4.90 TRINITY_DN75634_c0_g1_i1:179-490(-)